MDLENQTDMPAFRAQLDAIPSNLMSHAVKATLFYTIELMGVESGMERIDISKICLLTGQPRNTVSAHLKFLHKNGLLSRNATKGRDKQGKVKTSVRVCVHEISLHPDEYELVVRNHGGKRTCQNCGSKNVRVTITTHTICRDCGSSEKEVETINPEDDALTVSQVGTRLGDDALTVSQVGTRLSEGTSPCNENVHCLNHAPPRTGNLGIDDEERDIDPEIIRLFSRLTISAQENAGGGEGFPFTGACSELVTDEQVEFIYRALDITSARSVMQKSGEKKFKTEKPPITREDIRKHIAGEKTFATRVRCISGMTRCLRFDIDGKDEQTMAEAFGWAKTLKDFGIEMLLERSPRKVKHCGGGHLEIWFDKRVNAVNAYNRICAIVPALRDVREYWPRDAVYPVRLPGARYYYCETDKDGNIYDVDEWCALYDADGNLLAHNGPDIVQALMEHQTTAEAINSLPDAPQAENNEGSHYTSRPTKSVDAKTKRHQVKPGVDQRHQETYAGKDNFLFKFTEKQLAAWANDVYEIEDYVEADHTGQFLVTWRDEKNPSGHIYRETNEWSDFGEITKGGKPDGGDIVELFCRVYDKTRNEIMRDLGKEFNRKAKGAIKEAALAGEPIPAWISKYAEVTHSAKDHYRTCGLLQTRR